MSQILCAILSPQGLEMQTPLGGSISNPDFPASEGVYTIARTFESTKALLLDSHLQRLEDSARLEGIPLSLDRAAVRAALRELITHAGHAESRFRITIPRTTPQRIELAIEALKPVPAAIREGGAKVATMKVHRDNPLAKNTAWMQARQTAMAAMGSDIYEGLIVDEGGDILEGSSSNFYALMGGELWTAEQGVLHGIARQALLEVIQGWLPLRRSPPAYADIPHFQEAFLTSSGRGVVPIVAIDGQVIGEGRPGPVTRQAEARYEAWTAAQVEAI
jgi:branched-chain amino acid aminotransferase